MSDKDLNSTKEHLEREAFDYTLKGKADDVGIIAKGSAANAEGISTSEKKKKEDHLVKLMLDAAKDFETLLSDIEDKIKDYQRVEDRQTRRNSAFQDGDWQQYKLILINDYSMNSDEVNAMNPEDFRQMNTELDDLDEFTKETLKHEINDLIGDYDEKYGLTDDQKQKLEELFDKSKANGIDFNEALSQNAAKSNLSFHGEANDAIDGFESGSSSSSSTISDPFNKAAVSKAPNPFDMNNENENKADPFSQPTSSPNPFG